MNKQYKWRAQFASVFSETPYFIVAPTLRRALGVLTARYGREFLDRFLLEIKFHSVL